MEIQGIDVTKARSIGLYLTIDREFFDGHRFRNIGYVRHDDIVIKIGQEEKAFSFDEFRKVLGFSPPSSTG